LGHAIIPATLQMTIRILARQRQPYLVRSRLARPASRTLPGLIITRGDTQRRAVERMRQEEFEALARLDPCSSHLNTSTQLILNPYWGPYWGI